MTMIHNDEHETITVLMDYKGNRRIRPFYCVRCGKCIAEVTGHATAIIPGLPTEEEREDLDMRHVTRCGGTIYMGKDNRVRCTAKYIFN